MWAWLSGDGSAEPDQPSDRGFCWTSGGTILAGNVVKPSIRSDDLNESFFLREINGCFAVTMTEAVRRLAERYSACWRVTLTG